MKSEEVEIDGAKIYLPEVDGKYDFNPGFLSCCRALRKRVRNDFDSVIAITGTEGISKSTCANWIGFKTDKKYSFEKNCLFSPNAESMIKSIRRLPRFSAINGDEAIRILYNQEWWKHTFLNKFYRLCRQDNKITILCMPRFAEFNEGFRNHRIQIWIHLLDRGIGIAFQNDWNPFVKDPWHFKNNEKLIQKSVKRQKLYSISMERKLNILKKSANSLGVITFPDLPEKLRIEYKVMAAKHKYTGMEDELRLGQRESKIKLRYKRRLHDMKSLLKDKTGWSDKQIAQHLGISGPTYSRI